MTNKTLEELFAEMRQDKSEGSLYYAWQANIAVAIQDAFRSDCPVSETELAKDINIHKISNDGAKRFLDVLLIDNEIQEQVEDEKGSGGFWDEAGEIAENYALKQIRRLPVKDESPVYADEELQEMIYIALALSYAQGRADMAEEMNKEKCLAEVPTFDEDGTEKDSDYWFLCSKNKPCPIHDLALQQAEGKK